MRLQIIGTKAPIGVDLGHSTVKLAQLRSNGGTLELLAAGAEASPLPAEANGQVRMNALAGAIRKILKSDNFQGRHAVLSLPAEATLVQHVKLPKMPAEEIPAALRSELQNKLPYPVEDAVIRHVVAGETYVDGESKQEVMVVAASHGVVDDYLAMARSAKLDVIGLNIESCAVVECFSRLFKRTSDAARTILMVDLGAASTQVALSHGNRIVFARNLNTGCNVLDHAVADSMDISFEQAQALRRDLVKGDEGGSAEMELYHQLSGTLDSMGGELTQCLRYYESVFRNQAVERVIFVGGGAYDTRLCQALAKRMNLPAQIGDPLIRVERVEGAGMWIGMDRRTPQPDWAVAVGLSLGAAQAA